MPTPDRDVEGSTVTYQFLILQTAIASASARCWLAERPGGWLTDQHIADRVAVWSRLAAHYGKRALAHSRHAALKD